LVGDRSLDDTLSSTNNDDSADPDLSWWRAALERRSPREERPPDRRRPTPLSSCRG